MKRIRLQIQVLPWQASLREPANPQVQHQNEIKPWVQPEDPQCTLQQLVENIVTRYGRIYVGRGSLKVKELQDHWGSTLDLSDKISDIFDDRVASGDNLTSVCKVLRYPPDEEELLNRARFASLLPESAARPQKRPPPPLFHESERPLPSVELENGFDVREKKRRRIEASQSSQSPLRSNGHTQRGSRQSSLVQVADSQRAHIETPVRAASRTTPPVHRDEPNFAPNAAILESPTRRPHENSGRTALSKSASPEIPLSFKAHPKFRRSASASRRNCESSSALNAKGDGLAGPHANGHLSRGAAQLTTKVIAETAPAKKDSFRRRSSGPEIYDAIETDTESLKDRQGMFNARFRRASSKTPSRPPLPFKDLDNPIATSHIATLSGQRSALVSGGPTEADTGLAHKNSKKHDHQSLPGSSKPGLKVLRADEIQTQSTVDPTVPSTGQALDEACEDTPRKPMIVFCSGTVLLGNSHPEDLDKPPGHASHRVESSTNRMTRLAGKESSTSHAIPKEAASQQDGDISNAESDTDLGGDDRNIRSSLVREIESAARKHSLSQSRERNESNGSNDISPQAIPTKYAERDSLALADAALESRETPSTDETANIPPPTSGSTIQRKVLDEQSLTAEAEEAMLEAEGERALHAERERVQRKVRTPVPSRPNASQSIAKGSAALTPYQKRAQAQAQKQTSQGKADRDRNLASKEATQDAQMPPPPIGLKTRNLGSISRLLAENSLATPAQDREGSSTRSETTSTASRDRKTITPIWPGRSGSKSNSSGSASLSLASKRSADGLLQSAMRGATRRSSTAEASIGHNAAAQPGAQASPAYNASDAGEAQQSIEEDTSKAKTAHNSDPADVRKIRSVLKVTRDKKLKGRAAYRLPSPVKLDVETTPSPVIDSDDGVSSYIEEEDTGYGISKAGPSVKKKTTLTSISGQSTTSTKSYQAASDSRSSVSGSTESSNSVSNARSSVAPVNADSKQLDDPATGTQAVAGSARIGGASNASPTSTTQNVLPTKGTKGDHVPDKSLATSRGSSSAAETVSSEDDSQVDPSLIEISPKKPATNETTLALDSQDQFTSSRRSSVSSNVTTASSTSASTPRPATITTATALSTRHATSQTPSSASSSPLTASPTSAQRPPQPSQHSPLFLTQQVSTQQAAGGHTSPVLELHSTTRHQQKSPSRRPPAVKYPSLTALSRAAKEKPPLPARGASQPSKKTPSPFDSDDDDSSDESSDETSSEDDDAGTGTKSGKVKGQLPGLKGFMKRMFSSQP